MRTELFCSRPYFTVSRKPQSNSFFPRVFRKSSLVLTRKSWGIFLPFLSFTSLENCSGRDKKPSEFLVRPVSRLGKKYALENFAFTFLGHTENPESLSENHPALRQTDSIYSNILLRIRFLWVSIAQNLSFTSTAWSFRRINLHKSRSVHYADPDWRVKNWHSQFASMHDPCQKLKLALCFSNLHCILVKNIGVSNVGE